MRAFQAQRQANHARAFCKQLLWLVQQTLYYKILQKNSNESSLAAINNNRLKRMVSHGMAQRWADGDGMSKHFQNDA